MTQSPKNLELGNDILILQSLVNETDLIIFVKNKSGHFTFINKTGASLLQRSQEEIIGKDETDLLGPTTGFDGWESDRRVLATGKPLSSTISWAIRGVEYILQITKHLLTTPNGEVLGIIGIGRVVSSSSPGHKRYQLTQSDQPEVTPLTSDPQNKISPVGRSAGQLPEHHQKETKSLNRTLLALQSAMLAITSSLDLNHILDTFIWEMTQLLNVDDCIIFDLDKEKNAIISQGTNSLHKNAKENQAYKLDDYPLLNQVVIDKRPLQLIAEQIKPTFKEFLLLTSAGIQSLLFLPMVFQDQIVGLVGLVERRKKRVFSDLEISLSQMLASQTASSILNARLYRELDEANKLLQASNEELDAFAHTVAHDLRGPLGLMIGFSEVILSEGETMPQSEYNDFLYLISKNAQKMNNIINGLLMLSTVRKGEVQAEVLDMMHYAREAKYRITQQFKEHQAEFLIPDDLPSALGYGPWVEEVWINYLSNAVKYGGQPPEIQIGATYQKNGKIRYWVADNGAGLTLEDQAELFKPFTRLLQVDIEGHGLGLSIVRRIVEKLGGEVGIESEVGQGSTFYFTLPSPAKNF